MARPTKLTPDVQRTICAALQAGNYASAACAMAGIDDATFYRWMQRGARERRGAYCEFRDAVERATARGEVSLVAIIRKAAEKDWRAALALVERRHPERWGKAIALTGKGGGPIATRIEFGYDDAAPPVPLGAEVMDEDDDAG